VTFTDPFTVRNLRDQEKDREIAKLNARLDEAFNVIERKNAKIAELTAPFDPEKDMPVGLEVFEHEGQEGICIRIQRGKFCIVTHPSGSQEIQMLHPEASKLFNELNRFYGRHS
jgi:hypothetical protein